MDVFSIAKATHWPGNPTWGVMCTAHWHHQVFSPGSHQSPELWEFCATAKGNKINMVSLFFIDMGNSVCESCTALQARIKHVTRLLKILQLEKQTNEQNLHDFLLCSYSTACCDASMLYLSREMCTDVLITYILLLRDTLHHYYICNSETFENTLNKSVNAR